MARTKNFGRIINNAPLYVKQRGMGIPVFRGAVMQRGHGLGSLVRGLFRSATPLLKKGAMALGKEVLNTGMNIMQDTMSGQSLKSVAKRNVSQAGKRLARKALDGARKKTQAGGGRFLLVKRKRRGKKTTIRAEKSRAKRRRLDIFD